MLFLSFSVAFRTGSERRGGHRRARNTKAHRPLRVVGLDALVRRRLQPAAGGPEPDHHDRQQHAVSERCTAVLLDPSRLDVKYAGGALLRTGQPPALPDAPLRRSRSPRLSEE
jgi:hypothetical protein